jgi:glycosyltransferase involved in cell wall biosynthesis
MCLRNAEIADYCWREAIESVTPIADQIVVCDSESNDGTREALEVVASKNKKIKIVDWAWTNPIGDREFHVEWYNYAREHLDTDVNFQVEADEVLHECSHNLIRELLMIRSDFSRRVMRYNFWIDHKTILPIGVRCSHDLVRIGPAKMFMPSDYPHKFARRICDISKPSSIELFHYSFIRNKNGFITKSKNLQVWNFGKTDNGYLSAIESAGDKWKESIQVGGKLKEFHGTHPKAAWGWLGNHGYWPMMV